MQIEYLELPTYWASALINDDYSGLEDDDANALDAFVSYMIKVYGKCWCIDVQDDSNFAKYHDAHAFGVLACDVSTYAFDVTDYS